MPTKNGLPQRLSFVDIRKAYFNGIPKRNIFMSLPRELGLPGHWVGHQVRCVYGTRDAGAIWEDTNRHALETMGFTSGRAPPCIFHQYERDITTVVHGDDFTSLGSDANLDWLEKELATFFELKIRGRLGVGCPGDNEIRILNRLVRVTSEGLEYEADPRHVDLIVESLELADSRPVVTPGVKNSIPEIEAQKTSELASSTTVHVSDSHSHEPETATGYPENLLDILCAITSDNDLVYASVSSTCVQSRRMTVYPESALSRSGDKISHSHSVSFDENMNTYHNVSAYSRSWLLTSVICCNGQIVETSQYARRPFYMQR
jgi:hypothetical protein